MTLKVEADNMPVATLDVQVPDETRDLLIRLGWAPPSVTSVRIENYAPGSPEDNAARARFAEDA